MTERAPGTPVPILIVDDNPAKRLALKAILRPLGHQIVEADSGQAALRCVMAEDFAVILLDVRMPDMDGFETAARIRMRIQSEITPIIFITAYANDEIIPTDRYVEGAVDFMFAPVQPEELRAKVSVFANIFSRAGTLALRAREVQTLADQFRLVTDAAPIGIWQTDEEARFVYTNPHWSARTGIAAEDALGRSWEMLMGSEPLQGVIHELPPDADDLGESRRRFEIRRNGSSARVLLENSESVPDGEGGVAGWVGTLDDVTAAALARAAEAARHAAEERYRRIVETTMEGIWVIDADSHTTFANEAMARMLGTTVEEMQGSSVFDFFPPEDVENARQSIDARRAGTGEQQFEMKLVRCDGTVIHALTSATAMLDEAGTYVGALAMIRDVTEFVEQERRRDALEAQLRQSHRLESIGELAGGIAHDFNNLLLGIRGFGELALRRLDRGEDGAAAHIADMLEAADSATGLTRQLLAFGRRQVLQPQVIDLTHVLGRMETLLGPLLGERVKLVIASDGPVLVEADRTQLEQVIVNLAINARDAMADGGVLLIEAATSDDDAVLKVTDNGSGMDAATAASIFEPFFTTKGEGGSGLGLATVHGIVSQSGGRIVVDSEIGAGSTFSVFLPLSEGALSPGPAALPKAEGGADTILVVEDHAMVRTIVTSMLVDMGYNVLVADGGEAAAEIAAGTAHIDLLLTDLVMPGTSGRETADRVRAEVPGVKVLFMSGYTDDVVIRGGAFEPGTGFIAKPFSGDDLARRVREVLELELPPVEQPA